MSVLTVGETMALLDPLGEGELAPGRLLTLRLAGAESNFAVGLARLGIRVRWISRLGADPLGDMIFDALADEEIDLHYVARDPAAPTGVFLKWRSGERTQVSYYRKDSAASRLGRADVPDEALAGVRLVHVNWPRDPGDSAAVQRRTDCAARRMNFVTAPGCEMYDTWEELISIVRACARPAMKRWASGLMTWSWRPMRYQEGMVFQAGAVDFSWMAARVNSGYSVLLMRPSISASCG